MLKSAAFVSYGSDQKQWDSSGFNSGIFFIPDA
jgi:aminopeptidase-like protein